MSPFPSKMMHCPWLLCFDLHPLQYTDLTHEIWRFLVYIFLVWDLQTTGCPTSYWIVLCFKFIRKTKKNESLNCILLLKDLYVANTKVFESCVRILALNALRLSNAIWDALYYRVLRQCTMSLWISYRHNFKLPSIYTETCPMHKDTIRNWLILKIDKGVFATNSDFLISISL